MEPSGQPAPVPAPRPTPAIRASDQDRDAIAQRLQEAFAERRLDDEEFDLRMRSALTARTSTDLGLLVEDLPTAAAARPLTGGPARRPGRFAIALKSSIRRGGRWQVAYRGTIETSSRPPGTDGSQAIGR